MAINKPSFTTTPLRQAYVSIEMVADRPDTSVTIDPPDDPRRIVGFYNPQSDGVELYITSGEGTFWIPISN